MNLISRVMIFRGKRFGGIPASSFLFRYWKEDHFPDISNPGHVVGQTLEMREDVPRAPFILFRISAVYHDLLVMTRVSIERWTDR